VFVDLDATASPSLSLLLAGERVVAAASAKSMSAIQCCGLESATYA
jgi:hypothetical protein